MNGIASRFDFKEIQEKVSLHLRPWHRSFQFWVRTADIYTGYKVPPSLLYIHMHIHIYGLCWAFFIFLNLTEIWVDGWLLKGVSSPDEFREGCSKTTCNVGKTA